MKNLDKTDWQNKLHRAYDILESCCLCGHKCRVNRLAGELGFCGCGTTLKISHHLPHFGEEPPITGKNGSGTIFFSGCTMHCIYCQNYQISQQGMGTEIKQDLFVQFLLDLQLKGCHNINLVSPTPYIPMILDGLYTARQMGCHLPIVYNTNGYDSLDALELLDGVVNIYLPDFKYGSDDAAILLSNAPGYFEMCRAGLVEMYSQVGSLRCDLEGLGEGGLIVRHLLLPFNLAKTYTIFKCIAELFGTHICVSLLAQYNPVYNAHKVEKMRSRPYIKEYQTIVQKVKNLGFELLFIQEPDPDDAFLPDFSKNKPFKYSKNDR